MTQSQELRIERGGVTYVLHPDGDELAVGRAQDDEVTWSDTRVPLNDLGGEARHALETGEASNSALVLALGGILSAVEDRGG